MYLDDLGVIIARRELYMDGAKNTDGKIEIIIGKPRPFTESTDYYCPFQIVGIGGQEIKYAAGVDAIQSLQLVMVMIGANLQYLNEQCGGLLRWSGGSETDLGFPTIA